jgi:hypothetical protein
MTHGGGGSKLYVQWKHLSTCMPVFMLLIGYKFILADCVNSVNFEGLEVCEI